MVTDLARSAFQADLISVLRELRPGEEWTDPSPDENLWLGGYIDSIGLLEVIYHLEERCGQTIELTGDFMSRFVTLDAMFDEYGAVWSDGTGRSVV
ncbi:MAG: hypothetical protein ACQSGP_08985 [Frankia sp.]